MVVLAPTPFECEVFRSKNVTPAAVSSASCLMGPPATPLILCRWHWVLLSTEAGWSPLRLPLELGSSQENCQLELNKWNLLWGQMLIIADVTSEILGSPRLWVPAEKPADKHLLDVLGGLIVTLWSADRSALKRTESQGLTDRGKTPRKPGQITKRVSTVSGLGSQRGRLEMNHIQVLERQYDN